MHALASFSILPEMDQVLTCIQSTARSCMFMLMESTGIFAGACSFHESLYFAGLKADVHGSGIGSGSL